ncbi:MAG TPA: serine/threonine-protein kinase [Oligoflexia bacterium]|nr:serine/threonine-protein kinase [Oligoflexia bacterium]HMP26802.1 serine/threonine-protein kinase [Oligoflexia bacterium]
MGKIAQQTIAPGTVIASRFEVLRAIGKGDVGVVYHVRDKWEGGEHVALKILSRGITTNEEAVKRFRKEMIAGNQLNHPNIVKSYEYIDYGELQAYTMELIDGGTLANILKLAPIAADEIVKILLHIVYGLEAIHSRGILHRDLKPENLLISRDGLIKISDFGLARLKDRSSMTLTGIMIGTPKYLAPEYLELGDYRESSDIFAVGVLGYELITGKSPFPEISDISQLLERFKHPVKEPKSLISSCPATLNKIILKAIEVDPSKRYQSAAEMARDLMNPSARGKAIFFQRFAGI